MYHSVIKIAETWQTFSEISMNYRTVNGNPYRNDAKGKTNIYYLLLEAN